MEIIEVAAGVVRRADGRVLICRRTGRLEGLWEFPGGKLEPGETPAQCLQRELMEELDLRVHAGDVLAEVEREENGAHDPSDLRQRRACGAVRSRCMVHGRPSGASLRTGSVRFPPGGPGVSWPGAFVAARHSD